MKPRIVITGVAGFIGSNLALRLLAENFTVVGVDNLTAGVPEQIPDEIEFHRMDIRSPELHKLLRPGDIVFHLAAKNCISDCQVDPTETVSVNIAGTVNVFEAARKSSAEKVIYAESSAVYEGSNVYPTPESEIYPLSFYAVSKFGAMVFAQAFQRFYGLRMTALRYFCVYGPRQDYRRTVPPVMCSFILKLLRGERPIIYGTGEKRRDFVHVDDINEFHLRCISDARTDGRTFNLGCGVNYSVKDVYQMIASMLTTDLQPIFEPDLPGEAGETLADISAAAGLGWHPKVQIEAGLRGLIEYFRAAEWIWKESKLSS